MESKIHIEPIGKVEVGNSRYMLSINEKFRTGLKNIFGFSHLQIVWWGNLFDKPEHRSQLIVEKPYSKGPDKIGVFATRSQFRPNPILVTTIAVQEIDLANGLVYTPFIDAENDTPILDIKPYHLYERVNVCKVPEWCQHWPAWYEDLATFNWQDEFNF